LCQCLLELYDLERFLSISDGVWGPKNLGSIGQTPCCRDDAVVNELEEKFLQHKTNMR